MIRYMIYKVKVMLVTLDEGDPKPPFLIATKSRFRGARYSLPRIFPLYP